jgi:hypothetical protein
MLLQQLLLPHTQHAIQQEPQLTSKQEQQKPRLAAAAGRYKCCGPRYLLVTPAALADW